MRSSPSRSLALKRLFDVIGAGLLLVLAAPLLLLAGAILRCVYGRPILFRQRRPGLHGVPFTIYKLRTMRYAEGLDHQPLPDGARLTSFGRFLRAMSIDELPELINVLRGDMSLVGPRPLLMEYLPLYSPHEARRHDVKPGITGWAQIHGRNSISWDERFALDLWYVDNWSLWLDLRILAITAAKVLKREGISAGNHATMPAFTGSGTSPTIPRWTPRPAVRVSAPRSRTRSAFGYQAAGAFCAVLLSLLIGVGLIDPYGLTDFAVSGLNTEKTQRLDGGGRVERSLRLWLSDYRTLILGSSAARSGLDPEGASLAGSAAYNAAIANATMAEVYAIGRFALAHSQPQRVIIALNFSMFEADRTIAGDFEASGFDGDWMPLVYARTLATPTAFVDAAATVRDNLLGIRAADEADGFRRVAVGDGYDYHQAFTDVLVNEFLIEPTTYADFDYDVGRVRLLEDLVRQLISRGIETVAFVSPVHARQLEAVVQLGLQSTYERWLRDVALAIDRANADPATIKPASLWYFAGYNSVTTEDVPEPGQQTRAMRFYLNSNQYTPTVGELMLNRIFGTGPAPTDFGHPLTPATVDGILFDLQEGRAQYANRYPDEVADVERLVVLTEEERHNRLLACCS